MLIVVKNFDLIFLIQSVLNLFLFPLSESDTENSESSGIIVNVSRGRGPQKYGGSHEKAIPILGNPACA